MRRFFGPSYPRAVLTAMILLAAAPANGRFCERAQVIPFCEEKILSRKRRGGGWGTLVAIFAFPRG
jgi:hypothetical protein